MIRKLSKAILFLALVSFVASAFAQGAGTAKPDSASEMSGMGSEQGRIALDDPSDDGELIEGDTVDDGELVEGEDEPEGE